MQYIQYKRMKDASLRVCACVSIVGVSLGICCPHLGVCEVVLHCVDSLLKPNAETILSVCEVCGQLFASILSTYKQ